jgi:hypothetical protein
MEQLNNDTEDDGQAYRSPHAVAQPAVGDLIQVMEQKRQTKYKEGFRRRSHCIREHQKLGREAEGKYGKEILECQIGRIEKKSGIKQDVAQVNYIAEFYQYKNGENEHKPAGEK